MISLGIEKPVVNGSVTQEPKPGTTDNLASNLDESLENILEDVDNAKKDDNDQRVTVAKNVVAVDIEKSSVDGSVAQEPDPPDTNAVIAGKITPEFKTNGKAEEDLENIASSSLKTLMLRTIMKLEKLMHFRKVATNADNDIVMFKHGFDEEHNSVFAKVLVITTVIKPMEMPSNFSLLMYDVNGLDISKKPFRFPWRPGDLLCWVCYPAMMFVLVLQLLAIIKPSLPVSLLDDDYTDQGKKEDVLVDEMASADTIMVVMTLLSSCRGIFPRLVYLRQITPLKILLPGTNLHC